MTFDTKSIESQQHLYKLKLYSEFYKNLWN